MMYVSRVCTYYGMKVEVRGQFSESTLFPHHVLHGVNYKLEWQKPYLLSHNTGAYQSIFCKLSICFILTSSKIILTTVIIIVNIYYH